MWFLCRNSSLKCANEADNICHCPHLCNVWDMSDLCSLHRLVFTIFVLKLVHEKIIKNRILDVRYLLKQGSVIRTSRSVELNSYETQKMVKVHGEGTTEWCRLEGTSGCMLSTPWATCGHFHSQSFLTFTGNLPCFSLCLWPRELSLGTTY